jgi:hypothetical protein
MTATDYSEYGRGQIGGLGARALGMDVHGPTVDDLGGPVEVIALFQVLEHMDDPAALFFKFAELGTDEVIVVAAVPAPDRMEFNELNGSLLDMPPNHVGRWTPTALAKLAERTGWTLDEVAVEPEGAAPKLKQFGKYIYLRAMQDASSLANSVERIAGGPLRTLARAALAGAYTARHLPAAVKLATDASLGNSMWMRLSRQASVDPAILAHFAAVEAKEPDSKCREHAPEQHEKTQPEWPQNVLSMVRSAPS